MDWFVRSIIVYGDNGATRSISLGPGVNIITGDSKTGKSALIPIIDYCLGAKEYEVPVGAIREFARWYAILLQTKEGQIFLARKAPGQRLASSSMHIIIEHEVQIPQLADLSENSNRDAVVEELSRRLGMMDWSLAKSVFDTSYTEPPTARNVVPFLFQPQNVIANKDILFYKTDQERHREHRQRLHRIFPFVLGAIDAEYFSLRNELETAQRALRQLERSLREQEALLSGGITVARSLWDKAVALGLANKAADDTLDLVTLRLRLVALIESAGFEPTLEPIIVGDPERVSLLQGRSRDLRNEITILRRRLASAEELSKGANQLIGTLNLQAGRLRMVNLLEEAPNKSFACPVCNHHLNGTVQNVEHLRAVNNEVRSQLAEMITASPALSDHINQLRSQIAERRAQLIIIESELAELYRAQENAASVNATWAEQQRHLGAIRFYLERVPEASNNSIDLELRAAEARKRVKNLEDTLAGYDAEDRLQSALGIISQIMIALSKRLNLEDQDAGLRLDINRLTVIRDSSTGKPERLYEIGSGENWVGYHLCALFALHSFFIRRGSPVPSFLFLDQPSQIYFPEERQSSISGTENKQTDWDAVQRMYEMIFATVEDLDNRLQVVVVDHADLNNPKFQNAVRIRWRNGNALI